MPKRELLKRKSSIELSLSLSLSLSRDINNNAHGFLGSYNVAAVSLLETTKKNTFSGKTAKHGWVGEEKIFLIQNTF